MTGFRRIFRRHRFAVASAFGAVAIVAGAFACGTSAETTTVPSGPSDAGTRRDTDPVDPLDGGSGTSDAGVSPPPPSCTKYCELVQDHCDGDQAQYATKEDCLAFCEHIPPGDPGEAKKTPSLACRQVAAGSPAKAQPEAYCASAGPFGGGICGDRCTAFCQVVLSACSPDAGFAPYESIPDCKTACIEFTFRDAGADGGGE